MVSPRDLRALVRMAVEAEDAGIDGVMLSEHLVLGPSAGALGRPENPRDYAAPGNQDPGHAVARLDRADERDRRGHDAAAADRGRDHRAAAPSDPARASARDARPAVRGAAGRPADRQLASRGVRGARGSVRAPWRAARRAPGRVAVAVASRPASFSGRHYSFADVYLEPKPWRADGPRLWFGGMTVGPWIVRRLVEYGHGFHPFGQPTAEERRPLVEAMAAAGRDIRRARGRRRDPRAVPFGWRGRRPGRGGRGDPRPARGRLHDDLLQALAVHRRSGRGRAAVPPAGRLIRG